uniref:Putative tail protein n=1 Tax=viral metagenome TaxID=1070528 RepID=A0A6M3K1S1_9ZZZZ
MAETYVTVKSYRDQIEGKLIANLQKALDDVGTLVERQAKINATSPKPSGKSHDYVDTNRLASSITHVVGQGEVTIGTNVVYGKWLEFGHADGSRHYPWLFPAVESNRQNIINLLKGGNYG